MRRSTRTRCLVAGSLVKKLLLRGLPVIAASGILLGTAGSHVQTNGAGRTSEGDFLRLQKTFLQLINGDPVRVSGSPAVCIGGEIPPSYSNNVKGWFRSKGSCERIYTPDFKGIASPLTSGIIRQLLDPAKYSQLLETLSALPAAVNRPSISVIKKLEIQSSVWELLAALQLNQGEGPDREKLLKLKSKASALFCSTLLSDAEIRELPDNMSSFAPDYRLEIVDRILRHDPDIIEIVGSGGLHRDLSRNRFSTRVFITVDKGEQANFQKRLSSASDFELIGFPWAKAAPEPTAKTPAFHEFGSLGDHFDGLHAVLVLYFNCFNKDMKPVATNLVAGWQEYKITGREDPSKPIVDNIAKIQFTTIEYQRSFESDGPQSFMYRQAENNALANPATVFETSPVYEGTLMTTHRGKCVDCHIETVGSFFRMASRKTALTPPLLKAVDAFADERDLRKFRDFVGECRSNALPDGVPKKGERSRE